MDQPLILITNDDGVHSKGLWAAAEALAALGEVLVVAPEEEQSSTGRSLPRSSLGRIRKVEAEVNGQMVTGYSVHGSPAQTVQHALLELVPRPPDLVVSGINYGENIGTSVTISGTVGAAFEAAAFGIPYHTAWAALVARGCLQAGETLLVLGAAGGSGSAAVQLGRALGARVIAVAGGPGKLEQCRSYGAAELIDHRSQDFVEVVNQLTSDRGADLIFDPVGGDMCKLAVGCLASEGRLLLIGFASGASGIPSAHKLLLRNCSVMGVFVGGYSPKQRLAMHTSLLELYTQGRIGPLVDRTIAFAEIPAGLAVIEDRSVCGKIIASMA